MSASDLYTTADVSELQRLRPRELESGGPVSSASASSHGHVRRIGPTRPLHPLLRAREPELTAANDHEPLSSSEARFHERAAAVGRSASKRLLDLAGALAGLVFLAPFLLVIAALIRLESAGPAIFKQRRTGKDGAIFNIYKFRTMTVIEDDGSVVQAVKGDRRITPLGKFLRRSCIDELPQLWNVVRGEMSLVGPRPHALVHDDYYGQLITEYGSRFLVRPGIAGLAQVSGYRGPTESVEKMAGRVALDREYIDDWSLRLDLQILVAAVTRGPFHPAAH